MSKKKRILVIALCFFLLLLPVGLFFVGNYMVNFSIGRTSGTMNIVPPSQVSEEGRKAISDNWERQREQTDAWKETVALQPVSIQSVDGLKLSGEYALNFEPTNRWAITVHGYRGSHAQMFTFAAYFGRQGYNVLMPDLRGCGESGGDFIGMGWPDRLDMLEWIGWIIQRDPDAQIVLHGISMGGATVMMTAGESLPPQVKAIVEDCGYTSVWDIFRDEMDVIFHLPAFPILHTASLISSWRAGYSFSEASSLEQVKKATVPMLFIHGEKDNFVHTEMVYPLYEACPTEKKLLVVEDAGHGSSYSINPELYFDTVFDFLANYVK